MWIKNLRNRLDDVVSNLWENLFCKSCPSCGISIEKNEGCKHMECIICGDNFCWLCMQPYNKHQDNECANPYVDIPSVLATVLFIFLMIKLLVKFEILLTIVIYVFEFAFYLLSACLQSCLDYGITENLLSKHTNQHAEFCITNLHLINFLIIRSLTVIFFNFFRASFVLSIFFDFILVFCFSISRMWKKI